MGRKPDRGRIRPGACVGACAEAAAPARAFAAAAHAGGKRHAIHLLEPGGTRVCVDRNSDPSGPQIPHSGRLRERAAVRGGQPDRQRPQELEMKSGLFSFLLISVFVPLASAQEASPDALVKKLSEDVVAAIRQDKDIQAGDADKISALVEAKILPHFDFRRTTQVAMGVNWRRASADQQERLTSEFKRLLVRTYSGALASYRDQIIEFKPLRASPGDSEVTVRSQVKQSGAEPITIDYAMERTASGWKIFDVSTGCSSKASSLRTRASAWQRSRWSWINAGIFCASGAPCAKPAAMRPRRTSARPKSWRSTSAEMQCSHLGLVRTDRPRSKGCEECLKMGDPWVHLRLCRTCGHVGCCDESKNKHALK